MVDLSAVIARLAILFIFIAIGFITAKCKVFPAGTNKILAQVVIYIANPCMVLYSVLGSERQLSNPEVFLLTGIAVGSYVFVIILAQLLPRLLRCPKDKTGMYQFMIVFSNVGFLGFPVVGALFGENAVFYAAIFKLVFQFLLYTYGIKLVSPAGAYRFSPKELLTPIIIASVLAYIFYLTDFRIPQLGVDALRMLQNMASPLSMLVIGIALSAVPLKGVFGNWRLYAVTAFRLLILPIIAFFVLRPFVTNEVILGVTVVIMGMPIASMSTLMAAKYGGDEGLASSGVFLSTALSVITIPLLVWFLLVK